MVIQKNLFCSFYFQYPRSCKNNAFAFLVLTGTRKVSPAKLINELRSSKLGGAALNTDIRDHALESTDKADNHCVAFPKELLAYKTKSTSSTLQTSPLKCIQDQIWSSQKKKKEKYALFCQYRKQSPYKICTYPYKDTDFASVQIVFIRFWDANLTSAVCCSYKQYNPAIRMIFMLLWDKQH